VRTTLLILLTSNLLALSVCAQSAPSTTATAPLETSEQRNARMKWWHEARFGMFIHWGIYSVPASTYQDRNIPDPGEWIMNNGNIKRGSVIRDTAGA